jgi:hypothetical protein
MSKKRYIVIKTWKCRPQDWIDPYLLKTNFNNFMGGE